MADQYISVLLQGGHANRIFMIGAAMHIGKLTNRKFVVVESLVHQNVHIKDSCEAFKTFINKFPKCSNPKYRTYTEKAYCEPLQLAVSAINTMNEKLIVLIGYFQTFESLHDDLKSVLVESFKETIPQTLEGHDYFIHVRRGDYIGMKLLDLKFDFSSREGYYGKALALFESLSKKNPLVISDDPAWCKKQKLFEGMKILEKGSAMQALFEMSKCSGAICANSTMSYVGAWLQNSKEVVIMPKTWFADQGAQRQLEKGMFWPPWVTHL